MCSIIEKINKRLKELSKTELLAYNYIKEAKQPLAIRNMPHKLQGAVGKLLSKDLVERSRTQVEVTRHGFTSVRMTNCIKIKRGNKLSVS